LDIAIYGFIQSTALLLMAIGFSLVYGVCRLPNFAHGAIFVFTGYVNWLLVAGLGLRLLLAIPVSLLVAALLGVLIYQIVLKRIRGMEMSEVIATYAVGVALLETLRFAGLRGAIYTLPPFADGVAFLFGVPVDYQRIAVVALGPAIIFALWMFTRYTRTGLALRCMAQDERAAMMLGIDSDRMATAAVALGCALSGLAAAVLLPLGNIVVEEGYKVLIFAIAVCVMGGLGSWVGTVVASFVLGYSQYIAVAYGKPHYQMVVMLIAIIAVLIIKPSGLFGKQKELEERV
jgi:branched-chain amino acid transport system permease protein